MRLAITALVLSLAACGGNLGDDGPPPDAAGGFCSEVCDVSDTIGCGFDGIECACSSTHTACTLDSCDGRDNAAPYCSAPDMCTRSAPWCEVDGACYCLGAAPAPIACRTDTCEAP